MFSLEFPADAERDFSLIFDHLFQSYSSFGERPESALDHAAERILSIRANADRILTAPHRGECHDDILPGLRHLALDNALYWFEIHEEQKTVRVLAVFLGGQDHVRHMLIRLLKEES